MRPYAFFTAALSNRYFYPRTPSGVRPTAAISAASKIIFLSTHSKRSATVPLSRHRYWFSISIHALQTECDDGLKGAGDVIQISIHALQTECDFAFFAFKLLSCISIHALQAECDDVSNMDNKELLEFLSTHSKRSATLNCFSILFLLIFLSTHSKRSATLAPLIVTKPRLISIHALQAECDFKR